MQGCTNFGPTNVARPPPPTLLANFYFWWFCVTFPSLTDSGKSIARHPLTELITHTFINNIAISRKTDCRQMLLSVYNFVVFIRLVHRNHFSLVKSYDSRKRHPFIYTALSRNLSRQIPQKNTIHLVVYGKLNTIAFGLKKKGIAAIISIHSKHSNDIVLLRHYTKCISDIDASSINKRVFHKDGIFWFEIFEY